MNQPVPRCPWCSSLHYHDDQEDCIVDLKSEAEQLRSLLRWVASGEPATPEIRSQILAALSESAEQEKP